MNSQKNILNMYQRDLDLVTDYPYHRYSEFNIMIFLEIKIHY